MQIAAYLYTDPRLDPPIDGNTWGWEVDQIYKDTPLVEHRPQLQALLAQLQTQAPTYLLIRRLDELGDSLQTVADTLATLEAAGTTVIATEQPYQTPAPGAPNSQLPVALAEVQAAQRQRRIRQGHAAKRLKALPPPGKAPYGYRRGKQGYVIDRTAAPILKAFFDQFLLYGSLRGAVRYIAKQYGKKVSASTGRRWLEHPIYRGHTQYGDGGTVLNTHRPLLEADEAAQIDRLLRRNRTLPPKTASAPRSLAGLVTCQACQATLTVSRVSSPRRDRDYTYMRSTTCPGQCKAIPYDTLLTKTIEAICMELPKAVEQIRPPSENPKGQLATAIASKQAILEQLPQLVTQGILDQTTADLRTYSVQTEIAQLQQQLAQLPPVNLKELSQAVSIPQFWEGLSEPERRFFFREFIRDIQIIRAGQDWTLKLVFSF
ncbi:recombinase family protein [Leptolyngbya cf. ectocarpi LEGE 11479]|uniref:Recombinase family protein n=1 Tax=Leptolyngbya cf. ectocarpi LEGE 11479 TaxID=1828722 RepID=A0A928ZU81_LEPEC|nr:recombinase family protein [Leptolyngbya ectocarpi]MBE9067543.1 recombinase family protein [Leptolyngbya cf. ectocarpi LEGE 11479]